MTSLHFSVIEFQHSTQIDTNNLIRTESNFQFPI